MRCTSKTPEDSPASLAPDALPVGSSVPAAPGDGVSSLIARPRATFLAPGPREERSHACVYRIIACEIAYREIAWAVSRTPNITSMEFLAQGFHDNPEMGLERVQGLVDAVEPGKCDAILVGYGLCNHLVTGLKARHAPLVIPRAHDCLTFFFGSRDRYESYFRQHTGAYYYTSGWIEHERRGAEEVPFTERSGLGPKMSYEELIDKYGEDNAEFLAGFFDHWRTNYSRGVLIQIEGTEHLGLDQEVRRLCQENGWAYEETRGDIDLLRRWVDGEWGQDFLIVPPGYQVAPSYDEQVIMAIPADADLPEKQPVATSGQLGLSQ